MAHTLIIERTPKGRLRFRCECGWRYKFYGWRFSSHDKAEAHRNHLHEANLGGTFDKLHGLTTGKSLDAADAPPLYQWLKE